MCGFIITNHYQNSDKTVFVDLARRGPDSEKTLFYAPDFITTKFFRLGLVGNKYDAQQPRENADYIFCFNGEIYNFKSIVKKYNLKQSNSDTKICFDLLNKVGFENMVKELDGMFSIAVYDKTSKKICCAIDRFGQKPLYYNCTNGNFSVCSSLRTIAKVSNFSLQDLDTYSIDNFLSFGYFPGEMTPLKKTFKLMPGHIAIIDISGKTQIKRYCYPKRATNSEFKEEMYSVLKTSLKRSIIDTALHSDTKYVGVSFSGGLDSSLVCGTLLNNQIDLQSYTISFPDTVDYDEAKNARDIFKKLGGKNLSIIEIRQKEIEDACVSFFEQMDIPIADPSLVATQFVYKAARQDGLKYVVGGDGADELFLGYPNIMAHRISAYTKWLSIFTPELILKKMSQINSNSDFPFFRNLSAFITGNSFSQAKYRHFAWPQFNSNYFSETDSHLEKKVDKLLEISSVSDHETSSLDMNTYLPYNILSKVDMASMGWGVEARSPFLNKTFTEQALSFDPVLNINKHMNKKVLKNIAKEDLGIDFEKIKKHGFGFPYKFYLKKKVLKEEIEHQIQFCTSNRLAWAKYTKDLWQQINSGKDFSRDFWSLYVLNGYLMRIFS